MTVCLAVDLGASSGRVLAGIHHDDRLELHEVNRFSNDPIKKPDGWHWNLNWLFSNIKSGVKLAAQQYGDAVVSIGVDTWGVDYGLLDAKGELLCAPFQYRDTRTEGMKEVAFSRVPREEIYQRTGIQFMFFNTLFQLLAELKSGDRLARAERLLFMPDLIHYLLTGVAVNEKTIAGTSQLLNPRTQTWDRDLIQAMGLPENIFCDLVDAGSDLGRLKANIASETGATNLRVITPAGHDTASAVVGLPSEEEHPVFLSSGTWSLMGRELLQPAISSESFQAAFSNESGAFGTTCFLKNIAGMWLLQECKRVWDAEGNSFEYETLISQAKKSTPFKSFIDPDAACFQTPTNMPEAITEFCRRTGEVPPENPGEFTRLILESLALKYRSVKESLAQITGEAIEKIHIVGGGSQNDMLNQFTADALNCTVVAGPVEAASIGNIIMQLFAAGKIRSLAEGRAMVRRSFATRIFQPRNASVWDAAYVRFRKNSHR